MRADLFRMNHNFGLFTMKYFEMTCGVNQTVVVYVVFKYNISLLLLSCS